MCIAQKRECRWDCIILQGVYACTIAHPRSYKASVATCFTHTVRKEIYETLKLTHVQQTSLMVLEKKGKQTQRNENLRESTIIYYNIRNYNRPSLFNPSTS